MASKSGPPSSSSSSYPSPSPSSLAKPNPGGGVELNPIQASQLQRQKKLDDEKKRKEEVKKKEEIVVSVGLVVGLLVVAGIVTWVILANKKKKKTYGCLGGLQCQMGQGTMSQTECESSCYGGGPITGDTLYVCSNTGCAVDPKGDHPSAKLLGECRKDCSVKNFLIKFSGGDPAANGLYVSRTVAPASCNAPGRNPVILDGQASLLWAPDAKTSFPVTGQKTDVYSRIQNPETGTYIGGSAVWDTYNNRNIWQLTWLQKEEASKALRFYFIREGNESEPGAGEPYLIYLVDHQDPFDPDQQFFLSSSSLSSCSKMELALSAQRPTGQKTLVIELI